MPYGACIIIHYLGSFHFCSISSVMFQCCCEWLYGSCFNWGWTKWLNNVSKDLGLAVIIPFERKEVHWSQFCCHSHMTTLLTETMLRLDKLPLHCSDFLIQRLRFPTKMYFLPFYTFHQEHIERLRLVTLHRTVPSTIFFKSIPLAEFCCILTCSKFQHYQPWRQSRILTIYTYTKERFQWDDQTHFVRKRSSIKEKKRNNEYFWYTVLSNPHGYTWESRSPFVSCFVSMKFIKQQLYHEFWYGWKYWQSSYEFVDNHYYYHEQLHVCLQYQISYMHRPHCCCYHHFLLLSFLLPKVFQLHRL